jgi:hypothetical protein
MKMEYEDSFIDRESNSIVSDSDSTKATDEYVQPKSFTNFVARGITLGVLFYSGLALFVLASFGLYLDLSRSKYHGSFSTVEITPEKTSFDVLLGFDVYSSSKFSTIQVSNLFFQLHFLIKFLLGFILELRCKLAQQ